MEPTRRGGFPPSTKLLGSFTCARRGEGFGLGCPVADGSLCGVIAAGQGGGPRVVACGVGIHWPRVLRGSSFRCVGAAGCFASLLARFTTINARRTAIITMNGHESAGTHILARRETSAHWAPAR